MSSLVVSAVAKWNGAALKKGQKDLTAFQKTTLSLAKTFATVFATQKIYQFAKASVQAFSADEKAAKSLEIALKNTGNGFATIATEGFIARMQQTYKVLDDDLRPAFQTLLTATGSITKAQEGLQLALDVAAGSTADLASVSKALARGYAGNTQGLSRLNAGLDKSILKTGDMEKITAALTAKFQGQALKSLDTYAKKMDALTIAAANSKEIIGKGLLDSISALGGDDGITTAADAMETLAQNTADTIYGFSLLISKAKELGGISLGPNTGKFGGLVASTLAGAAVGSAVGGLGAIPGAAIGLTAGLTQQQLAAYGAKNKNTKTPFTGTSMYFTAETAARAKVTAELKKEIALAKDKNKLTAAELADKKKQAELDALKKKFDVDRINLETALLNSKDEAEKARIQGLLTIMDEDANAAAKRIADLEAADAAKMKAEIAAADNLKYLAQEADRAAKGLASLGNPTGSYNYTAAAPSFVYGAGNVPNIPATISNAADMGNPNGIYDYSSANPSFTYSPPVVQNITIEAPNGSEEYLTDAVKRAMQKLNRYGDSTTFAGAL